MWDLERENCIAQLNLPAGGGDGAAPAAEHMAASCHSPLLYAADSSGTGEAGAAPPLFATLSLATLHGQKPLAPASSSTRRSRGRAGPFPPL